jgi:uncharacterized protein (TIGR03086 family)
MTSPAMLYQRALDVFDTRIRAVRTDQWSEPTPCAEWNVRQLVNHVVAEDLWVPSLLAGKTIAEVGDAFDGDQLGADPVAAWTTAATVARAAAAEPGAESRTVHLSYGAERAAEYLMQLFADHLIHAWDLATAIGADITLPTDLVEACESWFAGREEVYRAAGAIGERVPVPAGTDRQTRLLAAFGRTAG